MADYDPTAALEYDATNDQDDNGDVQYEQSETGAEDDDYDPSSFNFPNGADDAPLPAKPHKPRTIGGFMVDSEDEEEQDLADVPPPSQLNGHDGAQTGLGALAVAEAQDDTIPNLRSEPQEDTAAVPSAVQTAQSGHLNGSTPVPAVTAPPASAPEPASTSATSLQPPATTEQGKAISPAPSTTATPQPPAESIKVTSATSAVPALTTQRLPHDKVGLLEDRIREDPKAEADAWKSLIAHYREKDQLENVRKVYWRFLEVFPSAVSTWYEFAQLELEHEQLLKVEAIFNECLQSYPSVDLWSLYLDYLRRTRPLINDTDGKNRGVIASAFEVVLEHVGIDPDAGKLWREYVEFVKSGPGVAGGTGWQDQQKMDMTRKAYQRAVRLPHSEYARLWKEYDVFELSTSRATARQNLNSQSPYYMTARGARLQLEQKLSGLDRSSLPVLPPLHGCAGDDEFAAQVQRYREWIEWEKDDPLVLKDEDVAEYRKRVVYVLKQATMQLRFYPQIWFDAATWCYEQATDEMVSEGDKFLEKGVAACPESVLLALKQADRIESNLESGNNDEVVIRSGEKLDKPFEAVHTTLYALMKKMQERLKRTIEDIQAHFASLPPEEDNDQDDAEEEDEKAFDDEDKPKSRTEQEQEQIEQARQLQGGRMDVLKRTISYVWVAKMRAFRRIQGQGAPGKARKGFRGVFGEARPRGQLSSDVYIASALMEWHCYKDQSASKIFERGLKLFPTDDGFALEYIKFLISRNDDVNARAVFETTITKIMNTATLNEDKKREKCGGLFGYMHNYESAYGDLAHIQRLEKRLKELYPGEPDLFRFAHRFELPTFDAIEAELVISPTQALAKHINAGLNPQQAAISIEPHAPASPPDSGNIRLGPNGPYVASPKRPLDDSDNESGQRSKFMRGESPLKGAAGRRLQNLSASNLSAGGSASLGGGGYVTKSYVPGSMTAALPPPLPDKIHWMLSMLPSAELYQSTLFDPVRTVELLRGLDLSASRARHGY